MKKTRIISLVILVIAAFVSLGSKCENFILCMQKRQFIRYCLINFDKLPVVSKTGTKVLVTISLIGFLIISFVQAM